MPLPSFKFLLVFLLFLIVPRISVRGEDEDYGQQYCVADVQTPDNELQNAINWACSQQNVACNMIQVNQPCYQANSTKEQADFVFNSYFQNYKHKGGNCYFGGAAIITEKDPSHDNCHFEYLP